MSNTTSGHRVGWRRHLRPHHLWLPANIFDRLSNYATVGAVKTVFGKRWVLAVVDEAHSFRTIKRAYRAAIGLRGTANNFVAMTATPVQTRPMVSISTASFHR